MTLRRPIILGDKRSHRRAMGSTGRRIRNLLLLGLVLGYVAWALVTMERRTLTKQALVDISNIERAARLFRADFGRCPDDMEELMNPADRASYFKRMRDPWGQPYQLICPARFDPGGVEVTSGGPDRSFAGSDNISSL